MLFRSGFELGLGRIGGHDEGGFHAQIFRRDRHGLRVIAGGKRHHAPRQIGLRNGAQEIGRASDLERPSGLEVLALKERADTGKLIETARAHHRCALGDGPDTLRGGLDVGEGDGHGLVTCPLIDQILQWLTCLEALHVIEETFDGKLHRSEEHTSELQSH